MWVYTKNSQAFHIRDDGDTVVEDDNLESVTAHVLGSISEDSVGDLANYLQNPTRSCSFPFEEIKKGNVLVYELPSMKGIRIGVSSEITDILQDEETQTPENPD